MVDFNGLFQIEQVKNAAANGRLFNVLMFALIVAVAALVDRVALWLAILPVLSIGAAYLADLPFVGRFARGLSIASIMFAVSATIVVVHIF